MRARRYAPRAGRSTAAVVIDNSATFRMRRDVPLIVPEVNADACAPSIGSFRSRTARRSCSARRCAPIRDAAGLRRVRVATYQAASGAGRAGLDELLAGERALARGESRAGAARSSRADRAQRRAANRRLRRRRMERRGAKIRDETRKMLGLPELHVSATAVRVPVRTAHSEAVFFETQRDDERRRARGRIRSARPASSFTATAS